MKKVLILSGSPRKGGNSDTLCDEFMKGAIEAGNEVEKIFVAGKNIGYCKACYATLRVVTDFFIYLDFQNSTSLTSPSFHGQHGLPF